MNSANPYFSVIIPTYNRAKFILRAVDSVLDQSFDDLELIVVDDGSTDETPTILTDKINEDTRLQFVKQENQGRSIARNHGINCAKGEYICFLDSDDYWEPGHLLSLHSVLAEMNAPTFAFTGLKYEYPDKVVEKRFPTIGNTKPVDYVVGNQVSTITVAIHNSGLENHRFNPSLSINEDLELWSRLVAELPLVYVDELTAVAVQHEDNAQALTDEFISPQEEAMELVFSNDGLKLHYSEEFKKRKLRGLLELRIRGYEERCENGKLIGSLLKYLFRYPLAPRNLSKLVMLIYALPGGQILKRVIQGSKASNG